MFGKVKGQRKDIPEVTDFLANNQTFKNTALGIHKAKSDWKRKMEMYLDKELLGAEEPQQIESKKKK